MKRSSLSFSNHLIIKVDVLVKKVGQNTLIFVDPNVYYI